MRRSQFASLLAMAVAVAATISSVALADVGINFRRDNGQQPVAAVDPVGVVARPNWNNTNGIAGTNNGTNAKIVSPTAGSLVDHNGVVIPSLNVAWYGNGTWSAANGDGLPGAGDGDMMSGYLDDTGTFGLTRVDVSGITYPHYDVIAYLGSDGNGRTGEITILGNAGYRFSTNSAPPFPGYVSNAPAGSPPSVGNSNAVRFTGLSGANFRLVNRRISNNVGLHGIEIVEMAGPAPAPPFLPPASEVGYWPLNGNVNDASGFDNHGAVVGAGTFVPGVFGQALSLNGTDQYAQISSAANPNFPVLQPGATLAISLWAKSTEPANNAGELVSLGDHYGLRNNTNTSLHFFQDINPGGNGWLGLTTNSTMNSERLFDDGQWHHIVAQKTPTHLELYFDGVLALGSLTTGSESLMNILDPIDYAQLGVDLFFGRHGNGGTAQFFNGSLDEIRIFEGVLTPQQVNNLRQFNSLVPAPSTNVLGALGAAAWALAAAFKRRGDWGGSHATGVAKYR